MIESVLFVGGNELGAKCLTYLLDQKINIAAVLCREEEFAVSRNYETVYDIARKHSITVCKDEAALLTSVEKSIQYGFCVMYPKKLSNRLLDIPKNGFYNFHGAPLPEYRGCMGHIWAILNEESRYGVTAHKMSEKFDAGEVLKKISFSVSRVETGITLHEKAVRYAYRLFCESIRLLQKRNGLPLLQTQDESKARYYDKSIPYGARISWEWDSRFIEKYIRALLFQNVLPPYTMYNGQKIHIEKAFVCENEERSAPCGTIVKKTKNYVYVTTGNGVVKIRKKDIGLQDSLFDGLAVGTKFEG